VVGKEIILFLGVVHLQLQLLAAVMAEAQVYPGLMVVLVVVLVGEGLGLPLLEAATPQAHHPHKETMVVEQISKQEAAVAGLAVLVEVLLGLAFFPILVVVEMG
jgi:hypothetical protein